MAVGSVDWKGEQFCVHWPWEKHKREMSRFGGTLD